MKKKICITNLLKYKRNLQKRLKKTNNKEDFVPISDATFKDIKTGKEYEVGETYHFVI